MKLLKRKPTIVGNSHYFRIDKSYINNGEIDKNTEYDLDVKKSKD